MMIIRDIILMVLKVLKVILNMPNGYAVFTIRNLPYIFPILLIRIYIS